MQNFSTAQLSYKELCYECYCTERFKNFLISVKNHLHFPKSKVKQSPRLTCQKGKYRKVLVFYIHQKDLASFNFITNNTHDQFLKE